MKAGFKQFRLGNLFKKGPFPDAQGETEETTVCLYDIFQSDLGQALILDTHINYPAVILPGDDPEDDIWTEEAQNLLSSRNGTASDPTLTPDEERQLIAAVMQNRTDTDMSDAAGRAIDILAYTDEQALRNLVTENQPTDRTRTLLSFLNRFLDLENNDDYTNEGARDTIRNQNRQALTVFQ